MPRPLARSSTASIPGLSRVYAVNASQARGRQRRPTDPRAGSRQLPRATFGAIAVRATQSGAPRVAGFKGNARAEAVRVETIQLPRSSLPLCGSVSRRPMHVGHGCARMLSGTTKCRRCVRHRKRAPALGAQIDKSNRWLARSQRNSTQCFKCRRSRNRSGSRRPRITRCGLRRQLTKAAAEPPRGSSGRFQRSFSS